MGKNNWMSWRTLLNAINGRYQDGVWYVAESGTVEPTTTPKNKTPLLLKKEETAVIEVDGNEYIYITEPDYITLTLIDD